MGGPEFAERRDELWNAITHGLGTVLAIAALSVMVTFAALRGSARHVVGAALFGAMLVLLYLFSTLYHALRPPKAKRVFRVLDHAAIFLLIAGTYTPFVLGPLRGGWGWSLFGVVWGCAVVGVVLKFFFAGRGDVISTIIYLAMGWLVLIAAKPLFAALPLGGIWLLVAGGLCYSFGTIFYLWEKLPFNHAVWHVWVLAGSVCHWVAVFGYVVPRAALP